MKERRNTNQSWEQAIERQEASTDNSRIATQVSTMWFCSPLGKLSSDARTSCPSGDDFRAVNPGQLICSASLVSRHSKRYEQLGCRLVIKNAVSNPPMIGSGKSARCASFHVPCRCTLHPISHRAAPVPNSAGHPTTRSQIASLTLVYQAPPPGSLSRIKFQAANNVGFYTGTVLHFT